MISIEDLITPLTTDDVKSSMYSALASLGVTTTNWKPGAVTRTVITLCAIVIAAISQIVAAVARAGFLDLSSGNWLTLIARYVYGVERLTATPATGTVLVTNSGGGIYGPFSPGDLQFVRPVSGNRPAKVYRNVGTVAIPALTSNIPVVVEAVELGTASDAFPGEISQLQTGLTGVTCTNPAAVLGRDDESDPDLILRCKEKLGALSPNGPRDAYAFFARTAMRQDGSAIGVNRIQILNDANGNVTLWVATASGGVTGVITDPTTDLGAIHASILQNATPLSVTPTTLSAVVVPVNVSYQVFLYNTSGLTEQGIKDKINAAVSDFFPVQPIGGNIIDPDPGKIFVQQLESVIANSMPEIYRAHVLSPSTDVVLAPGQIAVPSLITAVNVTQRAPNNI